MRTLLIVLVLLLSLVFVGAALAQDTPPADPAPTMPAVEFTTPEQAFDASIMFLVNGVTGGVRGLGLTAVVVSLVGLLKFIPGLTKNADGTGGLVSSGVLAFGVSAVLWGAAMITQRLGIFTQFSLTMETLNQAIPYIIGFLTTLVAAPQLHEYAARHDVPVLGAKKTPRLAEVVALNGVPYSSIFTPQAASVGTLPEAIPEAWKAWFTDQIQASAETLVQAVEKRRSELAS